MAKRCTVILILLLVWSCVQAFGQATANAGVRGRVLDTSGAAVVGADVTVSSAATGFSRTVKTIDDGTYSVTPVPAGVYSVKVAMAGFTTASAARVETLVGSTQHKTSP